MTGYILTNPSKPGVYLSCATGLIYNKNDAYYLLNHPDLKYVPTNGTAMLTEPGVLRLNGTPWKSMFGRYNYQGQYYIGKVVYEKIDGSIWFATPIGEISLKSGFEVLTCNSQEITTPSTESTTTTTLTTSTTTTPVPTTTSTTSTTTTARPPPTGSCGKKLNYF
jgi:hypothetical protein